METLREHPYMRVETTADRIRVPVSVVRNEVTLLLPSYLIDL